MEKATGIAGPEKSGAKKLLAKIAGDVPDSYCNVNVGAEELWRTSTQKNKLTRYGMRPRTSSSWTMTRASIVDLLDEDLGGDDNLGIGVTTVKQILLAGGTQELTLAPQRGTYRHTADPQCKILRLGRRFPPASQAETAKARARSADLPRY